MKYAISNIAWNTEFDEEMYLYLSQIGISGIEIAPTRIFPIEPYEHINRAREYRKRLQECFGLHVVSMQSIWYGRKENIFADERQRKNLIEYTKKAFYFAAAMGCPNLVFGCPKNRNMNSPEDIEIAIDFFEVLGDLACENGTVLALEANPKSYGTNFLNTTEQAVEFIKMMNHTGIRLNYDFGTVIKNSEKIADVERYVPYINHVHISAPNLGEIIFGSEHDELLKSLSDVEYENYLSLEMKDMKNLNIVKQKLNYLKERELGNGAAR